MSKLKVHSILIILFILIFSYFNLGEYFNYQKNNSKLIISNTIVSEKSSNFSLNEIRAFENIKIYSTPNKELLKKTINKIASAKSKVYIEVYMLTNKDIISEIIKAKERGLNIKIILEKNPYKIPGLNNKTYNTLKDNLINIVWSNSNNYSLNHTKLLIIDDEIIISSGNLTYSTFTKNKDLFVFIKDKILLNKLEKIFISDFNGIKTGEYSNNLVLSPDYSRKKLKIMLESAKNYIYMYFPYLEDDKLKKILVKKATSGIKIKIIVGKKFYKKEMLLINELKNSGINIEYLKKYKLHSKSILIDNKYLFIGSINFSTYSLDKNREIGIITKNKEIIKTFLGIFNDN